MAAVVTTASITLSSNRIQNGDIPVLANPERFIWKTAAKTETDSEKVLSA